MRETLKHKEAFLSYYEMGSERSLAKVGQKLGVSTQSVEKWSKYFNWQKKIKLRDDEIAAFQNLAQINKLAARKVRYREIIGECVNRFIIKLTNDEVQANKITDFAQLIKMDLLIAGDSVKNNADDALQKCVKVFDNYSLEEKLEEINNQEEKLKRIKKNIKIDLERSKL